MTRHVFRGIALGFEGVRTERMVIPPTVLQTRRGVGTCSPRKFFKFRGSEMPLLAFSAEHFQQLNTCMNV